MAATAAAGAIAHLGLVLAAQTRHGLPLGLRRGFKLPDLFAIGRAAQGARWPRSGLLSIRSDRSEWLFRHDRRPAG